VLLIREFSCNKSRNRNKRFELQELSFQQTRKSSKHFSLVESEGEREKNRKVKASNLHRLLRYRNAINFFVVSMTFVADCVLSFIGFFTAVKGEVFGVLTLIFLFSLIKK
jgi:hypothetical protein